MRTGANTLPQTLTPEAASVLKHSLTLAKRRGHSQVTPLHVASALLTSSRSNLFRRACLKSPPFNGINRQISHPSLHCRALELCFNVALNRLPTNPNPLFQTQPSLSNALIAALKRAQAHQRRGCIEQQNQQQQPFLAVKVELEQLVVSILDDPSVSRVMREAGFSSTAVKCNIEDDCSVVSPDFHGSSVGVFSSPCSPSSSERDQNAINPSRFWQTHFVNHPFYQNPTFRFLQTRNCTTDSAFSVKEDVKVVIEVLMSKNKKKNTVIVSDSVSVTDGIVADLIGKIESGEVPDDLKQTHFIKFEFSPEELKMMKRDDIETHLSQLKRKVDSFTSCGKGVIVCLGDLNWTVGDNGASSSCYSSVDHLVEEIGNLVSKYTSSNVSGAKVWVLGKASFQTYMRCQMRQPRLDVQWSLQAVSVPSGGLGLSLHASSSHEPRINFSQNPYHILDIKPFSGKDEEEDKLACCRECTCNFEKEAQALKSAQRKRLPPWLQLEADNAKQKFQEVLVGLRRKWNSFCQSLHQGKIDSNLNQNFHVPGPVAKFRRQNSCTIEFNFGNKSQMGQTGDPNLKDFKENEDEETKISLALGHSPLTSDSEKSGELVPKRTMKMSNIHKKLHENLPWQSKILPSIAEVLADSTSCRNNDIWVLIGGNDVDGKRRLAHVIADTLFGSVDYLFEINTRRKIRETDAYCQMLTRTLRDSENLVVFVEGVDSADTQFMKFLSHGFQTREFGESNRKGGNNGQVIFVLTTEDDCSSDEGETNCQDFIIQMALIVDIMCFDHKRKSEFETPNMVKNPRTCENKHVPMVACDTSIIKNNFSRQLSFSNSLDLNLKAEEDDEGETKTKKASLGFLGLIQNRFDLNRNQASEREMKEAFLIKIKNSFEEILGVQETVRFSVEEKVIEKLCVGSGFFLSSLFDKWVKEVFQIGLTTIKDGGKEGIGVIKLCFGGIRDKIYEDGFMGTCLPRKIPVSVVD